MLAYIIFGHSVGGRSDLPIPFWLFSYQAILALAGSLLLLTLFWRAAKLEHLKGRELALLEKRWAVVSRQIISVVIRIASVALFLTVLFATLFGDISAGETIAPVTIFIILWVGVLLLSGLLGDTWKILSPWNNIALAFGWLTRKSRRQNIAQNLPRPDAELTRWLAVFVLLVFVWMELVHPEPSNTRLLGLMIFFYTLYLLGGASIWGRGWLKNADAFAILNRLVGSLGIFSSTSKNGEKNVRVSIPLTGTARLKLGMAETAFVLVFLGSTTYDGISNTDWWGNLQHSTGWSAVPLDTTGLIATIFLVGLAYFLATRNLARTFAHSLIPIALAYSIAHYFSLLILEGQEFVPLLSDPLNQGWNLFGTSHIDINYRLVSTSTIAWVQAVSLLVGHLWGVFLAHDRALAVFPEDKRLATRSQYPLVAIMIGYTLLGLYLLLNA